MLATTILAGLLAAGTASDIQAPPRGARFLRKYTTLGSAGPVHPLVSEIGRSELTPAVSACFGKSTRKWTGPVTTVWHGEAQAHDGCSMMCEGTPSASGAAPLPASEAACEARRDRDSCLRQPCVTSQGAPAVVCAWCDDVAILTIVSSGDQDHAPDGTSSIDVTVDLRLAGTVWCAAAEHKAGPGDGGDGGGMAPAQIKACRGPCKAVFAGPGRKSVTITGLANGKTYYVYCHAVASETIAQATNAVLAAANGQGSHAGLAAVSTPGWVTQAWEVRLASGGTADSHADGAIDVVNTEVGTYHKQRRR